jgi:hypothetical protein
MKLKNIILLALSVCHCNWQARPSLILWYEAFSNNKGEFSEEKFINALDQKNIIIVSSGEKSRNVDKADTQWLQEIWDNVSYVNIMRGAETVKMMYEEKKVWINGEEENLNFMNYFLSIVFSVSF